MNKNKTNLSVVNAAGVRVKPSIIVGEQGSYSSGDILDANAVEKVVKNKVSEVVGSAAEALDTLEELGGALPTNISLLLNDAGYVTEQDVLLLTECAPDVEIFADALCTVYATGILDRIYVRINIPWNFNEAWYYSHLNEPYFDALAPNPYEPNRPYSVGMLDGSIDYIGQNEPFEAGLVIELVCDETDFTTLPHIIRKPVRVEKSLISTIYIDESNSDGYHKVQITGDIAVNKDDQGNIIYIDNKPSTKPSSENVISWIRENSRKVHAKYNSDTKALEIMNPDVSGLGDDEVNCFMLLPKFWYKCTDLNSTLHKLEFTHDENIIDSSWNEWDGDAFIGCYKMSFDPTGDDTAPNVFTFKINGTYVTQGLYGISRGDGSSPFTWISWNDGRTISRQAGNGFSMITYDAHKIMEILFYAYYGEVDAQTVCGAGAEVTTWNDDSPSNGRMLDIVPIDTDTKASDNPECNHFWGLCDWWGNVSEWIDDVKVLGGDDNNTIEVEGDSCQSITLAILNYDGSIKRVVRGVYYNNDLCVKKLWGKYADTFPIQHTYNYDDYSEGGFTVYGNVDSYPCVVARRSYDSDLSNGGVGYLGINSGPDGRVSHDGSRLQYTGPWVEVSQFS